MFAHWQMAQLPFSTLPDYRRAFRIGKWESAQRLQKNHANMLIFCENPVSCGGILPGWLEIQHAAVQQWRLIRTSKCKRPHQIGGAVAMI
ncbi:MAG: hypothetical protein ACJA06_002299 [Halocynthiibacter sp.]|jgi:hypothetical protein